MTCVDVDAAKVGQLRAGTVPIDEPGLPELVEAGLRAGTLGFTTEFAALAGADVVLVCVPTPTGADGGTDLHAFECALERLRAVSPRACVVVKSTVPVGTTERVGRTLGVPAVSNPEFLREGHAVHDFLHPDRVLVGSSDPRAADRVAALYEGLDTPVLRTAAASAELAKYASNAFLALKVSYVNVLAELCERYGADIGDVTRTMGLDERIGPAFLSPGPGWGGSCLPKDTQALLRAADDASVDFAVLADAVTANAHQHDRILDKVREAVTGSVDGALDGMRIGLLGLTFKAGTDDVRSSPAIAVAERLAAEGALLTAHDPGVRSAPACVQLVDDPALVAKDAAGIVLLTEWPQFRDLDWAQLAELAEHPTIVDCRNLLDPENLVENGFTYRGVGR